LKQDLDLPPGKAALLCIDLQEEHRQDERYLVAGFPAILANVRQLQETARRTGLPVIHAAYVVDPTAGPPRPFHPMMPDGTSAFSDKGSPLSAICAEVAPLSDELLLVKSQASVFGDGALAPLLRGRGIEWLIIAGVWTEACIDATVKQAIDLGFRVLLVKDACGSGSIAMHQTGILNLANRLYGGAVTNTAGACRLMAREAALVWMVKGSVPLRYSFADASELYDSL
jgi:maleamate amidohydrolase